MPHPIHPENTLLPSNNLKKMLEEDDDQGEMDMIFFGGIFVFTISQAILPYVYTTPNDFYYVTRFDIVMTNLWAFFPITQAQGLFLKSLLILTAWYSILWHWTSNDLKFPGNGNLYGTFDTMFSTIIVISYALSWLPKMKTYKPTYEDEHGSFGWWYKSCRGPPRKTSEWRCRWTPNLILNVFVCSIIGIIYAFNWPPMWNGYDMSLVFCWLSVAIALTVAIWHLTRGKMKIGKTYRTNFIFWVCSGIAMGIVSFVYKNRSNNTHDTKWLLYHSIWHVYVFGCAYCMSRAQEYLEIY
jgi:hypothetical protein